ncbi:TetR family transcriptional regulator [Roseiarcus fermentans]|uniref:TetR family transcriptional regulator n=1 Tax=Roseiarcus fermentans TaxID=1473586 RepID=A0A366ETS6_9HYPH|nr:TetR/AcrR family transcriptional regulator [Roseiarcus fermentans]RBP05797.1 TetR family transcriptional regulator [Roseiarcus fermentans]
MANVNLERRAEIGREKRARTKAQLIAAAKTLFARRSWETVTIDEVVQEAKVAKGTFYGHFNDLDQLAAAVADDLLETFDTLIQSQRLSMTEPLLRIGFGCDAFLKQSLSDRGWASLASRMALSHRALGRVVRSRLGEDLRLALEGGRGSGPTRELAVELVVGAILQVAAAIGEGRLGEADRPEAIRCVLAAIGVARPEAASIVARLGGPVPQGPVMWDGASEPSGSDSAG